MKRFLLRIINEIGYKISRENTIDKSKLVKGKPWHVEFIGPGGVGKSAIYNHLIKKSKGKYLTREDFVKKQSFKVTDRTFDKEKYYQELAAHRLEVYYKGNYNSMDKIKFLNWGRTMLIHDFIISKFNKNNIIISDENMMLSFNDKILEYLEEHKDNKINFKFLENHAIVYCYSSPDRIAKQIIKRDQEINKMVPYHKGLSFEELSNQQADFLERYSKLIELLKEYNIPVLELNTADNREDNVEKAIWFIDNLQKDKEYNN